MKTLLKKTGIYLFCMLGITQINAQNRNSTSIVGNGKMITRSLKTDSYNVINIRGSMDVKLIIGQEGEIIVNAEENVQDHILIESDGKTLNIGFKSNTSLQNIQRITVTVPYEELSEISLKGSGEVEGEEILRAKSLSLNVRGSGKMDLKLDSDSVAVNIEGSGKVELDGKSTDLVLNSRGSGVLKAEELICENVEANVTGSGKAFVYAKENLKTRIRGSGTIKYAGNPVNKDSKKFGSGKTEAL